MSAVAGVSTPRVVHCKREQHDVYIGRPSVYGNPFKLGMSPVEAMKILADCGSPCSIAFDGPLTREKAIECFRALISGRPSLLAAIRRELRGKVLGCWCSPKACHGDVLLEIANAPVARSVVQP